MDLKTYYTTLHQKTGRTLNQSTVPIDQFGAAHQFVDDLGSWHRALVARPESHLLLHIMQEVQLALYLNSIGLYRASFGALRLALELSFGMSHFSVNRLELAEWEKGFYDLSWAKLNDSTSGVLSARYAKAFFPDLNEYLPEYQRLASALYRDLSEFVHGNTHTLGEIIDGLEYSAAYQKKMFESLDTLADTIILCLCLRFIDELPPKDLSTIEDSVLDRLGHIQTLRHKFSSSGGQR